MMKKIPSPNYDVRPEGTVIDTLVLHYTGMPSADEALSRMRDPESKVSAHYMVDEDGTVYALVEEQHRAWHAGISHWHGRDNLNANSIGIEIVNPGHEFGYRPFPDVQMDAVIVLCKEIIARHDIPAHYVVGHACIAPDRKEDPGELFDWKRLAEEGIGHFPVVEELEQEDLYKPGDAGEGVTALQQALQSYGYKIDITGQYDTQTQKVVTAFQRRFHNTRLDGIWDTHAEAKLKALLGDL